MFSGAEYFYGQGGAGDGRVARDRASDCALAGGGGRGVCGT